MARTLLRLMCVVASVAAGASAAMAQSVEEFYRGRQVRFIVSTAAGGDYDQWSRLISRHWGRHIPGNPTFVVQNMPGAGGIIAANHLYTQASRDGATVGMIGRNLPLRAVLKDEAVRFDPAKFNYMGSPEVSNYVCVVNAGSPAERAEQLYDKEVLLAGAGAGTGTSTIPPLFSRTLGMKMKLVEGYGSGTGGQLAMERGEVHGLCQSYTAVNQHKPGAIASGKIKVLFNTERKRIPGLDAPSIFELAKTEQQRQILTMFAATTEFGRPILAPPEVPADRVAVLRQSFEAVLRDPELVAEAAKQKLTITIVKGEDLAQLVKDMAAASAETIARMQEAMK